MTVDFDDRRSETAEGGDLLRLANDVMRVTLETDGITPQVNIGLTLVDDEEIRRINRDFRQVDLATDVLSFPMTGYDLKGMPYIDRVGDIDPATGELVLGDIVLSVRRAMEQATEYGHSFEREFGYLVVHGMLHLLGYDHAEPMGAGVMREMEEKVLSVLSLRRD